MAPIFLIQSPFRSSLILLGFLAALTRGGLAPAAATDQAQPRIAIKAGANGAQFVLRPSDRPILIRGFNYIRLRHRDHATFEAATKSAPAGYDPQRAERMLGVLQSQGYNAVRVFILGRNRVNPGIAGNPDTRGVYQPYMNNVMDFLHRARSHAIYVLPAFGDGELPISPWYQTMLNPAHREMPNAVFFTKEGIAAKARYVADFLNAIKTSDPTLLSTLLGVECQNEMCVYENQWPFTILKGRLAMPNGKSYDMSDPAQRWSLLNDGLRYYHHAVAQAARRVDPDVLVAESIYPPLAVGKDGEAYHNLIFKTGEDARYPPLITNLIGDDIDFLDFHYYHMSPHDNLTDNFHLHERSSGLGSSTVMQTRKDKPVILGEFGEFRYRGSDAPEVAANMVALRDLALASGLQGYLFWTYDTLDQREFHHAIENKGSLIKALAMPANIGTH